MRFLIVFALQREAFFGGASDGGFSCVERLRSFGGVFGGAL
jgi:hypothetical protein